MASPELQTVVGMLRAQPPVQGADIESMRKAMEAFTSAVPLPEDVRLLPVDAGGVPAEWTTVPESDASCAIVYLHGGGYTLGSVATHRGLVARLARTARARVLSVDYRLGPEHPHPAAVEDGRAAVRYLLGEDYAPENLAVAGDSAGGGLTAATLLALRDAGDPLPAAGLLISPWLDLTLSGASMEARAAEDPMVGRDSLRIMADAYLAGADPRSETASPLFADLSGLPPLLLQVGTAEVLLDDSRRFADRARAAGVDVTLDVWDEMIHVWHAFADLLPEAREAIEGLGTYYRKRVRER